MDLGGIKNILFKGRKEAEEREAERQANLIGFPYLNLETSPVETDAIALIPEPKAREIKSAVIELKGDRAVFVTMNPKDPKVQAQIKELELKNFKLKIFVVSQTSLNRAWDFYKYTVKATPALTGKLDINKERIEEQIKRLNTLEKTKGAIEKFDFKNNPTSQVLEIILAGALAGRASDIHFEPEERAVKLRYRIDGDLNDVMDNLAPNIYGHLVSRIKLLSNLKINIKDEAQDGRFTVSLGSKEIELRVAVAPSEFGEVIVLRVLDPETIGLELGQLGLRKDDMVIVGEELERPNGMILNTGPTGSGKTTTLYAFLKAKRSPDIKIITIEDPIEYHLDGIEQTQVNPDAKYTFANGLRSIMRQDPDCILIGEIRDKETAEIAIQAALTGHLVFSTVHANEAAGAIPRLVDLGVKATSIGPALNLIIAQRLVKRLCEKCKQKEKIDSETEKKLKKIIESLPTRVDKKDYPSINVYKAKGCEACGGTGFKGRVAIYELLKISKELEALMIKGGGEIEIQKFALDQGMVTMQQDGVLKVISGITTFEEIKKITGPIEDLKI
ncbi:MAG: GspE/PulE family protein [Candidatus Pacebacteria bacterium]|nr:GspE/PulE family protein [Candidatus Paceibacterota bacterium]